MNHGDGHDTRHWLDTKAQNLADINWFSASDRVHQLRILLLSHWRAIMLSAGITIALTFQLKPHTVRVMLIFKHQSALMHCRPFESASC